MTNPHELLAQYAANGSEAAIRELVTRYVDLVYSVALRRMAGNTQAAEDVTQKVFIDLARKAGSLPGNLQLGGWLHRHACFVAGTERRTELRRQAREQEAVAMSVLHPDSTDTLWDELSPLLDEAIDQLADSEREALVLRFFERHDFKSIGAALGVSDDTAQKRVSRALERLRELLTKRGAGTGATVTVLGAMLLERSVSAAPASLATQALAQTLAAHTPEAATASAGVAGLSLAMILKWAAAAAALLLVGTAMWNQPSTSKSATASVSDDPGHTASASRPDANLPAGARAATTPPHAMETNLIRLTFVAADSGAPVPGVLVQWRAREDETSYSKKEFIANRLGICELPLDRTKIQFYLDLLSISGGFADTRLLWNTSQGDVIPASYTLKLQRAVRLGGQVVGPDGKTVAGAQVGFGYVTGAPVAQIVPHTGIESHEFHLMATETDDTGRWSLNRIGKDMLPRLTGSARHASHAASDYVYFDRNPQQLETLLAGTHVFKLGTLEGIHGLVLDPDERPVANARVTLGYLNGRGESNHTNTTHADGTFTITDELTEDTMLTAEAAGYAPTTIAVSATNAAQSHLITLERGRLLKLRVTDAAGKPLPQARVQFDTLHSSPLGRMNEVPPIQSAPNLKLDEAGRAVWTNAPQRDLFFSTTASGYIREHSQHRPEELEHHIVLGQALTIRGTVTDAVTGMPIPKFQIVVGNADPMNTQRIISYGNSLAFSNGRFQKVLEDLTHLYTGGHTFRFEAPDHAPFTSRLVTTNETDVEFEVQLQPASETRIAVRLSDGRAASRAFVFLGRTNNHPITVFHPNSERSFNGASLVVDDRGAFRLAADPDLIRLAVCHPEGFAVCSVNDLRNQPEITLQPWGRISGRLQQNGAPVKEARFKVGLPEEWRSNPVLLLDLTSFGAITDEQGRFTIPAAPPGLVQLRRLVPDSTIPGIKSLKYITGKNVEVTAGETLNLDLTESAYRFTGHVQLPEGMKMEVNWRMSVGLEPQSNERPNPLPYYQNTYLLNGAEGNWTGTNILAGQYQVVVRVSSMVPTADALAAIKAGQRLKVIAGTSVWHAFASLPITLPPTSPDEPIDLGTIRLEPNPQSPP